MPPPNPFAKIKGHVEGKWLEEVYQNDSWLPLEEWANKYEPKPTKKEDSEFKKHLKAKVASKAKDTIVGKLQSGISAKLTLLILEAVSKVLNQIETKMAGPAKEVINTASAIVLSYRFQNSKKMTKKKAEFLRSTAIEQLTQCVDKIGVKLSNIQKDVRSQLAGTKSPRSFISDKIDEFFSIIETKSVEVQTKVETVADGAEAALKAAGIERPPAVPDKEKLKDHKDEIVVMLSSVIKDGILSKLDTIAEKLSAVMDNLFVAIAIASDKAKRMKDSSKLQLAISSTVEEMHSDMEEAVNAEVSRVVLLIASMTEKPEEEASEEKE